MMAKIAEDSHGSYLGIGTLISNIEILSDTDESNRSRNMSISKFPRWVL